MSSLALIAAVAAYVVTVATVPVILRTAITRKLLDYPGGRHAHSRPVPRLGGVAVFFGLLAGIGVGTVANLPGSPAAVPALALAMLAGGAILFGIGLFDDLRGVPPVAKIAGQTLAAFCVWSFGFRIETLVLPPSIELALGWASLPVTILWIVGVSNAFNLVDGMDGLAGTVAIIALLASIAAAMVLGNSAEVWYCLALGGALIGFLRYNVAPARIFLGDSGSLVVGFLLAVLTVRGAARADGALFALAPIFALSYPLLDTGIAIMRRWLRGEPLSRADGRHIHHQLQELGLGPRPAVGIVALMSAGIAILGLSVTFARPELTLAVAALGGAILAFIMVYGLRWLQYHEFSEAGASIASAARQARSVIQDKIVARDLARLIGRAATLDEIQTLLHDRAADFRFVHMELRCASDDESRRDALQGQMTAATAWRLEWPVAEHRVDRNGMMFLNIWCDTAGCSRPAGAERVARILAPSLSSWLVAAGPLARPTPAGTVRGALSMLSGNRKPARSGGRLRS